MKKSIFKNEITVDADTKKLFRDNLTNKYMQDGIIGALITVIALILSVYAGRNIYEFPLIIMYLKIAVTINLCIFIILAITLKNKKTRIVSNVFIETIAVIIAFSMISSLIVSVSMPEHMARASQVTMAILIGCVFFAGAIRDRLDKIILLNLAGFIILMIAINGFSLVRIFDVYLIIVSAVSAIVFNRVYKNSMLKEFLLKCELNEKIEQLKLEIDKKENLQKKLVAIASFDPLTKAYSRRHGLEILKKQFLQYKKEKQQLSICYMDMDNLKEINDNHGHSVGDECIIDFIEVVSKGIRGTDYCIRMGGDEFILVLPGSDRKDVDKVCQRIKERIETLNEMRKRSFRISVSHGVVSLLEREFSTYIEMIDAADKSMYQDKANKKTA